MNTLWIYTFDQKTYGPLNTEKMLELLDQGVLNNKSPVRNAEGGEWRHLEDSEIMAACKARQDNMIASAVANYRKSTDEKGLKKLFTWWFIFVALHLVGNFYSNIIYGYVFDTVYDNSINQVLRLTAFTITTYFFYVVALVTMILQFVLLYRLWKIIQDGVTRTTPGKAVGYLFIPGYNLYWYFRAFRGFSIETNAFIDRHYILHPELKVRKSVTWISLVYSLFMTVGTFLFTCARMENLSYIGRNLTGQSFNSSAEYFTNMQMVITSNLVQSILLFICTTAVFWDFYLTPRSILKAEEQRKKISPE